MPPKKKKLRIAMPAWEIGRANTGLGVKVGGLAVVVEELPLELVKAAAKQNLTLEVETLTPCFAHYDRNRLTDTGLTFPATIDGHTFEFQVFKHTFPDGQTVVYFWDEWQLNWTSPTAIYPTDPEMAYRLFAAVSQAMAGYIKSQTFHAIHSHDYHVGFVPFYLGDDYLAKVAHHFTIHNATYQGMVEVHGRGFEALWRINLPGELLFHKYFDHFDHLNMMKAVMLKTHESGGKITTVSGDISGTWGYAAELRESHASLHSRAEWLNGGPVAETFLPNRHLDLFEQLPIAGITNGLSDRNKAENLPELKADNLQKLQEKRGLDNPLFQHPYVQAEMLGKDHNFDLNNLPTKALLKRLLHLEVFGSEMVADPILLTVVGRLVGQKNLGLVVDVMERTLAYDTGAKFVVLASAPDGDGEGKATEAAFRHMASRYPHRVYYNNDFNLALSKLIFAGGDFALIPSRFEPCGLVDYEASLLGNIVIGHLIGGLAKVRHCSYLYEWLDVGDRAGEANAFFQQIRAAIDTYRHNPDRHAYLIREAMSVNATWDGSAAEYVAMYQTGILVNKWYRRKRQLVSDFAKELDSEHQLFQEFFRPAHTDYNDALDWALRESL